MIRPASPDPAGVALRHPDERDHETLVRVVDEWFGGRRVRHLLSRAWFRHAASTSWLAEDPTSRPIGFLVGQRSQDREGESVIHLLAVQPGQRRRGVGRMMVERFVEEARPAAARPGSSVGPRVTAVAWPDDPIALAFFRSVGFVHEAGPGSQPLYGVPAWPDYEGPGEDRVVLVRRSGSV